MMHRMILRCLAVTLTLAAPSSQALGPHEVLLLVNGRSDDSITVANHYIQIRHIPPENVVRVDLPDALWQAEAECTAAQFTTNIWIPASRAIADRGLSDRILAWAYSADFPVRVRGTPAMSVHGLTWTHNEMPPSGVVVSGMYGSVLFRGPAAPGGRALKPASFDNLAMSLGRRMPVPAMSLTQTGARGLRVDEAVGLLEAGGKADGSRPQDPILILTNSDVRSRCRAWQFEEVCRELAALGVKAEILPAALPAPRRAAGLMMGVAGPEPARLATFAPGAMAEHLTSFGAIFHMPDQTKLTAWLKAGASSSAGTVTEPFSLWTKFPAARFFVHYAAGCSLLESYAESVASPMQLHLVGDPLLKPWAPKLSIAVTEKNDPATPGRRRIEVRAEGAVTPTMYLFLLDGRLVTAGPTPTLSLDTANLADGFHSLRVVAYGGGEVRAQATAEMALTVAGAGRSVELVSPVAGSMVDALRPFKVRVRAAGGPAALALFSLGRRIADAPGSGEAELTVNPAGLGEGPVQIQPVAVHAGGVIVRGAPVVIVLEPHNRPPVVGSIQANKQTDGSVQLRAESRDDDGDTMRTDWFRRILAVPGSLPAEWTTTNGTSRVAKGTISLTAATSNQSVVCFGPAADTREVSVEIETRGQGRGVTGLAYDVRDDGSFSFFGWWDEESAWCMGSLEKGNVAQRCSRGVPAPPAGSIRLSVRQDEDGTVVGLAGDRVVCRSERKVAPLGKLGILAGRDGADFRHLASRVESGAHDGAVTVPADDDPGRFEVRASDGFGATWREVTP